MSAPWPCDQCGAPGFRNVFARGYCFTHLAELYASFEPSSWGINGVGLPAGARRADHGPEFAELECSSCGATWIGTLLAPCTWCQEARERLVAARALEVLERPDVDLGDRLYGERMTAWAERMAVAVKAGIVPRERVETVWRRAVGSVAA